MCVCYKLIFLSIPIPWMVVTISQCYYPPLPCRYSIHTHMGATVVLPPPDDDWSVNMVTSAWKTNNGFPPDTHTQFHDVEHPRYRSCLLLVFF